MKKLLPVALALCCLMNTAFAQKKSATPTASSSPVTIGLEQSTKTFHQNVAALQAALNDNKFSEADGLSLEVRRYMARRGDELRKVNGDSRGAEKRYALATKLKDLSKEMKTNKVAILKMLPEMDATF